MSGRNSGTPLHKLPRHLQDQVARSLWPHPQTGAHQAPNGDWPAPRGVPSPYPLILWLDYRVPSLNTVIGGGRWTKKKHDTVAAKALNAALAVMPGYPRQGSERLHVLVTSYVIQVRDPDNPTQKFLLDQMRKTGLLRNDDPGSIALTVNPEVKVGKRKLEGTKIVIVPALP